MRSLTIKLKSTGIRFCLNAALLVAVCACGESAFAFSPTILPPESQVYVHLEKLADFGLMSADVKAIKPFSDVEAARLVMEATRNIAAQETAVPAWSTTVFKFIPPKAVDPTTLSSAMELVMRARGMLPREAFLRENLANKPASVDVDPAAALRTLSSSNIPLGSPVYGYLDKLAGMGLITSDVKGVRPYSKAEAARLALEAIRNIAVQGSGAPTFAMELITRIRELLPREVFLREHPDKKPRVVDFNPASSLRMNYVYLNGKARDYRRPASISAKPAFGFIGGTLTNSGVLYGSGTEGTPLVENNNGVTYGQGSNGELRWAAEGYVSDKVTALVEPMFQASQDERSFRLNRGYIKLGGGGLELEAGRDENWFGPGYRGALTLSSNAQNFDQIKLSSPEPLDIAWVKRWFGGVKYALVVSRFDKTDAGTDKYRQPYFIGLKLALKPYDWFEYGFNFVRQEGGPGFAGKTNIQDFVFGGGYTNHSNSIAGIDLRFRMPWLRNTEIYGEYIGEDSATFWPVDESYVAGVYAPCLTSACRDDLRFEFFWGSTRLYTDGKFPRGYTYHNMSPGHSQGGSGVQDFYLRYSHFFSVRNVIALEYFHTDRGQEGRVKVNGAGQYDPENGVMQAIEHKDAGRISWTLPIYGDVDSQLMYGIEKIRNMNLVEGVVRTNQLATFELRYQY